MAVRLEARWKLGRLLTEIERMKATESGKLKGKRSSHDVQTFSVYPPRSISTATPPSAHSGSGRSRRTSCAAPSCCCYHHERLPDGAECRHDDVRRWPWMVTLT